jgi:type I restriction-modification system DNA methylase subunit
VTDRLTFEQRHSIGRISGLVLINAMIFQEILASYNSKVRPLQRIIGSDNPQNDFFRHWDYIISDINYYPIFFIAKEIISSMTSSMTNIDRIIRLANTAQEMVRMRLALRHDLMGRIYHKLLAEKKYLGTYYTSIPAATLLLKLAFKPSNWQIHWSDIEQLQKLRVADLACGTGTLLMLAADCIMTNYVNSTAGSGRPLERGKLQNVLSEKIIYGYDVLLAATHLTASTLALRAPEITFEKMNLFCLPLGGSDHRLGSIEYFESAQINMPLDLFGSIQVKGKGEGKEVSAPLPFLDLCIMNPPFTRSVGGNLLFGSLPEKERKPMQKQLKKITQKAKASASITAGLGSVFAAMAHSYIKLDGRMGLVLPKALLSGVSWKPTRKLLEDYYQVEYIISSHDPLKWNFSESTSLSEILLLSKKTNGGGSNGRVHCVNLWRSPKDIFEALSIAKILTENSASDIIDGQGALEIVVGKKKFGEANSISWNQLKEDPHWMLPWAFAQSDLIRVAAHLHAGELWLPGHGIKGKLQICQLSSLGNLGPDARDVHDGFRISRGYTPYPAFWGHDAKEVFTISQKPNVFLSPLPRAKKGRNLRKVEDLWPLAGKFLISERMRLNSQRLACILLPRNVLSSVWWSFTLRKGLANRSNEKALALWLNSTLGMIVMLSNRLETEGAWVKFKKPVLHSMPVLDIHKLTKRQLALLSSHYDRISKMTFQPFPMIDQDPVRVEIDKAITNCLRLPDISILREMLAREPIISLKQL